MRQGPDGWPIVTRRRGADVPIRMPVLRDSEPDVIYGEVVDDGGPWIEDSIKSFRPFPTRSRARGWVRAHPRAAACVFVCALALVGTLAFALTPAGAPAPAHAHSNGHGSGFAGFLFVFALASAAIIAYAVSLKVHPYRKCHWCKGRGKHYDRLFTWAHGLCSHCGGSGRRPRLGVRLFRHDEYLKMTGGQGR